MVCVMSTLCHSTSPVRVARSAQPQMPRRARYTVIGDSERRFPAGSGGRCWRQVYDQVRRWRDAKLRRIIRRSVGSER